MGIFSFLKSNSQPIYEPDEAKVYIYDRLNFNEKQRLTKNDILDIIEIEFKYSQEKGIIDDNTIKLIQEEGNKKGRIYTAEDINRVFDIEEDYMKSIGIEITDTKK